MEEVEEFAKNAKTFGDLWPAFAFIGGILWKQVVTHFEVKSLKLEVIDLQSQIKDNEAEIDQVKTNLHEAINLQGKENNESMRKLTEVVAELAASTKVMAAEMGFLKSRF